MIGRSEPVDPHPAPVEESLAPAREQLPLPRRRQQAHLEPQLREPGSPGGGTPFSAFSAPNTGPAPSPDPRAHVGEPVDSAEQPPDAERTARIERPADRAAAFRAATRRGRRPGQRPRRPRA